MSGYRPTNRRRLLTSADEGSATVLVLAFTLALVLLATALATGVALAGAGQRARTAADLAALAAADRSGPMGTGQSDACAWAAKVAAANRARLIACMADPARSRVEVASHLPWGGEVRRVAEAIPGG